MATLEYRVRHGIASRLHPMVEDYVYSCRQGDAFGVPYHTHPSKPVQGAWWVKSASEGSAVFETYGDPASGCPANADCTTWLDHAT